MRYIGKFYTSQVEKTVNALIDSGVGPLAISVQDSLPNTVKIWVQENGPKSIETYFTRLGMRNRCF